jgi:hypothetical protein
VGGGGAVEEGIVAVFLVPLRREEEIAGERDTEAGAAVPAGQLFPCRRRWSISTTNSRSRRPIHAHLL